MTYEEREAARMERERMRKAEYHRIRKMANGVIVSTSTNVARTADKPKKREPRLCCRCGRPTSAPADFYGRRRCPECLSGLPPKCETRPPGLDARIEQLAAMYAAALEYPTEGEARRAGLPTTSEELPWETTDYEPDDEPESDGREDGEDAK